MFYSVSFLRMAASFGVASSTSMFAAQRLLWKPIFHHFVPRYLFFLRSHGYDDIQTSNEFLLIFTINTTYTPNIFTGEWVNFVLCCGLCVPSQCVMNSTSKSAISVF